MTNELREKLLRYAQSGADTFSVRNHIRVVDVDDGSATVELTLEPESLNCWGTPHGGVLFTMADVAAGTALLTLRQEMNVTVSSGMDFLSAASGTGTLRAVGRVERAGGHMGFARTEIWDGEGRLIAVLHTVMSFTGHPLAL